MKPSIIPAILSGGAGTRLWPVSTDANPKQFHALAGEASLLAQTVLRVAGETDAVAFAPPIILASAAHAALVEEHLGGNAVSALVIEPAGRNTAAPAVIAAALAAEITPDALVLLLPADHLIADREAFLAALARAAAFARDRIVTFGVTPNRPATGYGYIKSDAPLGEGVFAIESFREKPSADVARDYLDAGGYSWNSGMFLYHPQVLLQEFAAAAEIRDGALAALSAARREGRRVILDADAFVRVPAVSLDVAIMERTRLGAVALCEIGWTDIGAWDEVWRVSEKDACGNAVQGEVVALDAADCLLRGEGVTVCVAGVRDLIVVATPEGFIVVPRERAQEVRALRDRYLNRARP